MQRIDSARLAFPPEVYDDRKREYEERIAAILRYAEDTTTCRSRLLLQYFGDHEADDCGQCDVCMARNEHPAEALAEPLVERFRQLLADGKGHSPEEFEYAGFTAEARKAAIELLMGNEEMVLRDGFFYAQ